MFKKRTYVLSTKADKSHDTLQVRKELRERYGFESHDEGTSVSRSLPQLLSRVAEIEVVTAKILHFLKSDDRFLAKIQAYTSDRYSPTDTDIQKVLGELKRQYYDMLTGINERIHEGVDATFVLEPNHNTLYFSFDPKIFGKLPRETIQAVLKDKKGSNVPQEIFWQAVASAYILGRVPEIHKSGNEDLWELMVKDYKNMSRKPMYKDELTHHFGVISPSITALTIGKEATGAFDYGEPGVSLVQSGINPSIFIDFRDFTRGESSQYFTDGRRDPILERVIAAGVRNLVAKPGENYPHPWNKKMLLPYEAPTELPKKP